jgi:putative membrane protein
MAAAAYWNDWYSGWGWFLWFGVMIVLFSSVGNWGYTYRVHRNYGTQPRKEALDILEERYARGEITSEKHARMKSTITAA